MSRREFMESVGATCINWRWSWSYINQSEKIIIFGAWDKNITDDKTLILRDDWKASSNGRKTPAYKQSREHVRLVEEEGYPITCEEAASL